MAAEMAPMAPGSVSKIECPSAEVPMPLVGRVNSTGNAADSAARAGGPVGHGRLRAGGFGGEDLFDRGGFGIEVIRRKAAP